MNLSDKSGWIKLHRKVLDCWIWQEKPYDKARAWVDLLLLAMHRDKKLLIDNEMLVVERGSFMTSILKLSDRWGWSRNKVKRFLELLEDEQMLNTKRTPKGTLVTIVKYEDYQVCDITDEPTLEPTLEPTNEPTDEPQNKNIKNIKNDKNINNNICAFSDQMHDDLESFFESIWQLYPIKKGKGAVSKAKKQVLQRIGYDEIKRCVERYVSEMTENKTDKQYWKHGSTFFNSGYVDYLDKNYGGTSNGCTIGNDADKTVDEVEEAYYRAFFGK